MKKILFIINLMLPILSIAQQSYIYLEGIKDIPFYVKLNDKEVPHLGKNYVLIPNIDSGLQKINIGFVNNNFDPHTFNINTQNNAAYGYKLIRKDETTFALQDVVNVGTIENNASNVYTSNVDMNKIYSSKQNPYVNNVYANVEPNEKKSKKSNTASNKSLKKKNENTLIDLQNQNTNKATTQQNGGDKQYGVLEVITSDGSEKMTTTETNTNSELITTNETCTKIISQNQYNTVFTKIQNKADDEARINFMKKNIDDGCYTADQVSKLIELFDTQYARFSFIKLMYPVTTDPSNLIVVESAFKYSAYKERLRKLIGK